MQRILVIRGGAIGDFVLTLPAIRVLRERFPAAHLEILGYKNIIALAENRFYADATRSLGEATLVRLFTAEAELPTGVVDYFGAFDLILSYLSDPDKIFEQNTRRCGVKNYIAASPRATDSDGRHAAAQLADALRGIGTEIIDLSAKLYPSQTDRDVAQYYLAQLATPIAAIHPGSGGARKNWPIENWSRLGTELIESQAIASIVVVAGEADENQLRHLQKAWRGKPVRFATDFPLPHLAAILERCSLFLGHDSGISHIAAAVATPSVLLFGPTNPAIWAPRNENVRILRAPNNDWRKLSVATVRHELDQTRSGVL